MSVCALVSEHNEHLALRARLGDEDKERVLLPLELFHDRNGTCLKSCYSRQVLQRRCKLSPQLALYLVNPMTTLNLRLKMRNQDNSSLLRAEHVPKMVLNTFYI